MLHDLAVSVIALLGGTLAAALSDALLVSKERNTPLFAPVCCLSCGRKREFWDRVPFLSWLLNGGKCRFCGAALSSREPILSLLTIALWPAALQLWLPYGAVRALLVMVSGSCLLCASGLCWIGGEEKPVLLPLLLCASAAGVIIGDGQGFSAHLLGALGVCCFCLLLRFLPERLLGGERLRVDTLLYLTCTGLLIGWRSCFVLLPGAVLVGVTFGLAGRKKQRSRDQGPEERFSDPQKGRLSPSLCVTGGMVVALVFGRVLMELYLGLFARLG
jgi:leader peptidase (prepilin peptidase)/N-methyltransferase